MTSLVTFQIPLWLETRHREVGGYSPVWHYGMNSGSCGVHSGPRNCNLNNPTEAGFVSPQEIGQNDARLDLLLQAFTTTSYLPSYVQRLTQGKTYKNLPFDDGNPSQDDPFEKLGRALDQLTSLRSLLLAAPGVSPVEGAVNRSVRLPRVRRPSDLYKRCTEGGTRVSDLLPFLSGLASTAAARRRWSSAAAWR